MIKKNIMIFLKNNDIVDLTDIISYNMYFKTNELTITNKNYTINTYKISEISQVIISIVIDKVVIKNDTIIF